MEVLTAKEGEQALKLAREVLEQHFSGKKIDPHPLPPIFMDKLGAFVTLTRGGELCGCIGFPYPSFPLMHAIRDAALAAALEDPRFPPVTAPELPLLRIEITVLSPPGRMDCPPSDRPGAVEVGRHGLIVRGSGRSGLLLPQVPLEYDWDSRTFLSHTCLKACLPADCWKDEEVEVFTFEGQIFHE